MSQQERYLIFGGNTGWIGKLIITLLQEDKNNIIIASNCRLEDKNEIEKEIDEFGPFDAIFNCAGVTGRPNVDWCEEHKIETIRSNVLGTLSLVDVAFKKRIHVTNFGTGCLFEYDETHPMPKVGEIVSSGKDIGFKETDTPNFDSSFYSSTKGMLEKLLQNYPNVLQLRLRMPMGEDLHHRSIITKLLKYEKVVNIPNSMSVLYDLLPICIDLTKKKKKGIYNFTNPGAISHNQILELYKKYIDPSFTWKNFSLEEQDAILKAKRSNNLLDTTKLENEYSNLIPIYESVKQLFIRMSQNNSNEINNNK